MRLSPLLWLNLVCLDAPLVAVSWHWLFARSFQISIPRGTAAALFLTAWLIYLADRFADSVSLGETARMSVRQRFCLQHQRAWLAAIALIAIADAAVVVTQLDVRAMLVGAGVGGCAFLYLAINRLRPAFWSIAPLKEISIGFIFAAGTMVGLLRGLTSAALPAWLLFGALCAMNCICIAVWERELDLAQQRVSIATAFPHARRLLLPSLAAVCLTSAVLALGHASERGVYLCLAASALLLALVHLCAHQVESNARTALADLVLLTPLIGLLVSARL